MLKQNRILWGMIALSVVAHLILYTWFYHKKHLAVNTKRGVVSVSFVQSVTHEPTIKPVHAKSKILQNPTLVPSPSSTAITPQTPNVEAGDPRVVAHESDIFIDTVTRLLGQNKIYPQEAIDREEEGKVIVGLTLDRGGGVLAANIEEPSPFQLLNDAALRTVHAVTHFPQVPEIVPAPIHLHVPLVYRIEHN